MAGDDAFFAEMGAWLPGDAGADPLALDEATAERLLGGWLDPGDAPPGYAGVARLLAAVGGPAGAAELAGPPAVVAAAVGVAAGRRAARRARRARVLVAVVAVVGVLLAGGVAVALGGLPGRVGGLAGAGGGVAPGSSPAGGQRAGGTAAGGGGSVARGGAGGGAAAGGADPGLRGLCRAVVAGRGGRLDARLVAAAGGAGAVEAFCARVEAGAVGRGAGRPRAGGEDRRGGRGRGADRHPDPAAGTGSATASMRGLCRSYLAERGGGRGGRLDAAAMRALTDAAGSAGRVEAYCQGVLR